MNQAKVKPNVLFFFTDDQRFNTIEAVNNPDIITPNLKRLVERGTYCTRAYIMGGTSAAVCMPSRAMVHTGKNLFHLCNSGESIPADHVLIGEYFQRHGYTTYGIGKWHNGIKSFTRSFSGGDKIFFGGMDDHWNVPVCSYHAIGEYPQPRLHDWDSGTGRIEKVPQVYDDIKPGRHSTDLFADTAIDFLRSWNPETDAPFFLYTAFMAPHDPRTMPKKYLELYDADTIHLPENFMPQHPFDNGEMDVRDEHLAGLPRTETEIRKHLTEYYAMITHLDDKIGKILDEADQRGILDTTIIILAGDNGLALGSHGLMGKQNLYDHSLHVPLLFAGPGVAENKYMSDYCYLLDIFPTLCDLTGIAQPKGIEGQSLIPHIAASHTKLDSSGIPSNLFSAFANSRDSLFFAYKNIQRAILDRDGYKLILYFDDEGVIKRQQLFNLDADPLELENLIRNATLTKRVAELQITMHSWMVHTDDPLSIALELP